VKNHLRAGWGAASVPGTAISDSTGDATLKPEYSELLPNGLKGLDDRGLGLPLQLTFLVEGYIRRGFERGWFHAPQASQMQVQLNTLTDAFGRMETIRLTSVPVAHLYVLPFPSTLTPGILQLSPPRNRISLRMNPGSKSSLLTCGRIHQKQVLATFSMILPFALVSQMAWWAVPIVVLVTFTLYGIDGIASQLEDPFGFDRNDIKMDSIVEDIREEIALMVEEWKRVGDRGGEMFLGLGA